MWSEGQTGERAIEGCRRTAKEMEDKSREILLWRSRGLLSCLYIGRECIPREETLLEFGRNGMTRKNYFEEESDDLDNEDYLKNRWKIVERQSSKKKKEKTSISYLSH